MVHRRSEFGCWTCRVRRKKCDEQQPICKSCSSRGIPCHGYGSKPSWLDGGRQEKTMLEKLRTELKIMLRQRKDAAKWQLIQQQQNHFINISAIKAKDDLQFIPLLKDIKQHPSTNRGGFTPLPPRIAQNSQVLVIPKIQENHDQETILFAPILEEGCEDVGAVETSMLMIYLDQVFPLQFSCYSPQVEELGRGWLLRLLTQTKPLYHVAIALSAFHTHSTLLNTDRKTCIEGSWQIMEKHHALAFEESRFQLEDLRNCSGRGLVDIRKGIQVLACSIQMISFELLRGSTDSWHIHLEAASALISPLIATKKGCLTPSISHKSSSCEPISTLSQSVPLVSPTESAGSPLVKPVNQGAKSPPPSINEITRDFLVGTFVWFDILASASTRTKPFLHEHSSYLGVCCIGDSIELNHLMGCENWVMLLIASISHLDVQFRNHEIQKCRLDATELLQKGSEIEKALENGLRLNEDLLHQCQQLTLSAPSSPKKILRRDILQMTRIFAHSAIIYLHTILLGADPTLPPVSKGVSLSICAFRELSDPKLLRNLIWPLCIAGCMAQSHHEDFFSALIATAGLVAACPGNIWKAYEVMRECWRLRGENKLDVDWTKAMTSTGHRVLLV